MKILIIDYDCGNIASIYNALNYLGYDVIVGNSRKEVQSADRIILPGVGTFEHAMKNLEKAALIPYLNQAVLEEQKPILGICLGAQIMLKTSEESEGVDGLAWVNGTSKKITVSSSEVKATHMGWNNVYSKQQLCRFENFSNKDYYFNHSYGMHLKDLRDIVLFCDYGENLVALFKKGNIWGCQFHPEKSSELGLSFLNCFCEDYFNEVRKLQYEYS